MRAQSPLRHIVAQASAEYRACSMSRSVSSPTRNATGPEGPYPFGVTSPAPDAPSSTTEEPVSGGLVARLRYWVNNRASKLLHEVAKFGVVGLAAFVVDVGVFNLLRYHSHAARLYDKPITAKIISTILATLVAYLGNRFWTFRQRDRVGYAREYLMFFLLNAVGLGISIACLTLSHYVLNLRSPLADNISANVIGLGLGTIFRFWAYRRWVFPEMPDDDALTRELRQPV
jgi:putative flippase GtrA